jgi:carboxyl-terminal processing protease
LRRQECGIGVEVCRDERSGLLRIVTPIKDSPAYKVGLRAGDVIARITQEQPADDGSPRSVATKDLPIDEAKQSLLGRPKSKIRLDVYRHDPTKLRTVIVPRDWSERETVFGVRRKTDDSWDFMLDTTNKIAYVRIKAFARSTSLHLARAVAELERQGAKGLILDVRGCSGLLESAVEIAEIFLDRGLFVSVKSQHDVDRWTLRVTRQRSRIRLACLIDGDCTGASELLAACLQDHRRVVLVGERSSGGSKIQHLVSLRHGDLDGDLRVTVAVFYRANGRPISKIVTSGKEEDDWGVRPDEDCVVKLTAKEREQLAEHLRGLEIIAPLNRRALTSQSRFQDRQLEKAVTRLRKQIG